MPVTFLVWAGVGLPEPLQQAREFEQIGQLEWRAPRADGQGWILGDQAGPGDRHHPQTAGVVVVVHLIDTPIAAGRYQFKGPPC